MLFNLLIQHGGGEHNEREIEDLKMLFFLKLRRIRVLILKAKPKQGESPTEAEERFKADRVRMRAEQRPHTRRRTVSEYTENLYIVVNILNQTYDERIGICLENMNQLMGKAHDVWCNLHEMLVAMGPDGVSSDEESVEDNRRLYCVKVLPHRSARVLSRIIFIDSHANHTNGYGNNGPGTAPRTRIRSNDANKSTRKAPIGWPENLYKSGWVEEQSDINYGHLNPQAELDLIPFGEVQRFAGVCNF